MGFLSGAINAIFYPAVMAGKVVSSGGKKVKSGIDNIIDTIESFFQISMGVVIIGGMTVLLLLAKNPRLALLAL